MAKLKPKEKAYYAHFSAAAQAAAEAAAVVTQLTSGSTDRRSTAERLASLAEVANSEYRSVLMALRASFVTPFERTEIQALSRALASAARHLEGVGALVNLLDPPELPDEFAQIARLIDEVATATTDTLGKLKKLKGVKHHHEETTQAASEAEFHRRLLLVTLTDGDMDPLDALEIHAISDEMAAAMGAFVDVAEVVETVLITEG